LFLVVGLAKMAEAYGCYSTEKLAMFNCLFFSTL